MKRPEKVTVVRARLAHANLVAPLLDDYRRFYKQPSDMAKARKFLRERLKRVESVIFLAMNDQRAVGFVQLYPSFDSVTMRRVWILHDLFVTVTARKRGVAKLLMKRARQFAMETKAKGLILETAVDNVAAQKLYERLGWTRDMAFDRYYRNV